MPSENASPFVAALCAAGDHLRVPRELAALEVEPDGERLLRRREQAVQLSPEARGQLVERRGVPRGRGKGSTPVGHGQVLAVAAEMKRRRAEPNQLVDERGGGARGAAELLGHQGVLDREARRAARSTRTRGSPGAAGPASCPPFCRLRRRRARGRRRPRSSSARQRDRRRRAGTGGVCARLLASPIANPADTALPSRTLGRRSFPPSPLLAPRWPRRRRPARLPARGRARLRRRARLRCRAPPPRAPPRPGPPPPPAARPRRGLLARGLARGLAGRAHVRRLRRAGLELDDAKAQHLVGDTQGAVETLQQVRPWRAGTGAGGTRPACGADRVGELAVTPLVVAEQLAVGGDAVLDVLEHARARDLLRRRCRAAARDRSDGC